MRGKSRSVRLQDVFTNRIFLPPFSSIFFFSIQDFQRMDVDLIFDLLRAMYT